MSRPFESGKTYRGGSTQPYGRYGKDLKPKEVPLGTPESGFTGWKPRAVWIDEQFRDLEGQE